MAFEGEPVKIKILKKYLKTLKKYSSTTLFIECGIGTVINQAFLTTVPEQTCQHVSGKSDFDPKHARKTYFPKSSLPKPEYRAEYKIYFSCKISQREIQW